MQTLVVQATDYGVWGDVMREQKSDESVYRFGYQGQFAELDEETGWSHFQLREYDAVIGRWMVVDPYRQYSSPDNGNGNNPVMNIDPSGGENPIYSSKGEFRGGDEFGLQGPAIIYDGEFTNGMSQIEILGNGGIWFDLYQFDYNNWAVQGKIYQHLRSLPARSDWDGFVTISEGVAWAKAHPGALQNPTADNMLYVNSATLDFGGLSESDFPQLNKPTDLNLFNWSG